MKKWLFVMFGILTAHFAFAADKLPSVRVGDFEVVAILDGLNEFPEAIFPSANKAVLRELMPEGKAPGSMSAFLLKGKNGERILVDSGLGNAGGRRALLLENLKRAGVRPEEVSLVLLTHMHGDHIGGLTDGGRRVFPNARVMGSRAEFDYWVRSKEALAGGAKFAAVANVAKIYGKDFEGVFAFGEKPAAGVTALDAVGHTPGHTAFLVESNGGRLLIVGDLLHAAALQFAMPEICSSYDMDADKAVASRRRILGMAADEGIPIAGMHLPPPGMGAVRRGASGGFVFEAVKD